MSADSISTPAANSRDEAMTPAELAALIAVMGERQNERAARMIGVHRTTVQRWLAGSQKIGSAYAALIRSRLGKVRSKSRRKAAK